MQKSTINILKFSFTALLIAITAIPIAAENFSVAVSPGFSFYSMHSLQKFNRDEIEINKKLYPVGYKSVEDFPGNIFFNAESRFQYKTNHFIGLGYQYHSTGSRISYKDYSSELRTDIINEANVLYLLYNRKYPVTEDQAITLLINYNLLFNTLYYIDYEQLGSEITTEKITCHSISHALTVGFDFTQRISIFELGFRISFMHDLNALLISGEYLFEKDGETRRFGDTEAEWNGIRGGLLFAVHL